MVVGEKKIKKINIDSKQKTCSKEKPKGFFKPQAADKVQDLLSIFAEDDICKISELILALPCNRRLRRTGGTFTFGRVPGH